MPEAEKKVTSIQTVNK